MKKKLALIIIPPISAILLLWIIWGNITIGVTHYTVSSNTLPTAFNHYKIAVVSDLHNASFGENNIQLISLIEKEKPDIITITGDFIDSNKTNIDIADKLAKKLVELAPCYYVTGNHEAWIGNRFQELEKKLLDSNIVILHNNAVNLTKNNEIIQLAGLDDFFLRERASTKLKEMNLTKDYCVLMSHRPEAFDVYVSENIDLVLSGHAHGGQFRLPFIGGVVAPDQGFFPKYDGGEYHKNNTTMIVSRGIGNSIIPIRFNNRPEIVIVELLCL